MSIVIPAPKPFIRLVTNARDGLRIVYFGTPPFAVPALRHLATSGYQLSAVVTAPDKPVGRHSVLTFSPVKTTALELGIPVHLPVTLKDDAFFNTFSELRPDLCIVVAYGKLIPERYLKLPRLGFLNIHPSFLPAYRGPSPIQTAILDGCASTGVSLMVLDNEMDHGPVLAQLPWTIPSVADEPLCESELARLGAQLLGDTLPGYIGGKVIPKIQDHERATFTKKFERQDGHLDWSQPAYRIHDRIRALAANPGAWTTWLGKTLNIFRGRIGNNELRVTEKPGTVVRGEDDIGVVCGEGVLIIEELQLEGRTRQDIHEFINGRPAFIGATLL